jgi:hypothetical protein
MTDADRYKLLGRYRTPRVRIGTVLSCEYRDRDVKVIRYSGGRIAWPVGKPAGRSGSPGLVLYGGLAQAVQRESNQAVAYWFGVNPNTVSLWRKALDVKRTNAGTHRLRVGYGAEHWFAEVGAKGRAKPWTPERRKAMSKRFKGKPLGPVHVAAIRKAQSTRRKARGSREGTGHKPEDRAKIKQAMATKLAAGWRPNGRAWTKAEDRLVLTLPLKESARRTKRTWTAVYKRRRKLRLAATT